MKLLALPLAIIAIVFGLALASPLRESWEDKNAHARALAAIDEQRQQTELELWQAQQAATLPARIAGQYGLLILLAVAAGGILWVGRDFYLQRRTPLARFDADKPLVSRRMLELSDDRLIAVIARAVELSGQAAIARAEHQGGQAPHVYSPTITNDYTTPTPPAVLPAPVAAPAELEGPAGLPETIELANVIGERQPGTLIYGQALGGAMVALPYSRAYHALAGGDTRSGKSNLLDAVICQLHHDAADGTQPLRLLIGDFKKEMYATWARSPLPSAIESNPLKIARMLVELTYGSDGIHQRYETFKKVGESRGRIIRNLNDYATVTGERPMLTFIVVDELNALLTAANEDEKLTNALKIVLQLGAGAGIYVLGGAQYLNARTLGRDASKQFSTRALFGAFDATAAGVMFGATKLAPEHKALLTGQGGRGLIRTVGQAQPLPFQSLHCTETDILAAIRSYRASAARPSPTLTDDAPAVVLDRAAGDASRSASEVAETVMAGHEEVLLHELLNSSISAGNHVEMDARAEEEEVLPGTETDADFPHSDALLSALENDGVSTSYSMEEYYSVKALREAGLSKTAIIKALWKATGGAAWIDANDKYTSILAKLEGGAA